MKHTKAQVAECVHLLIATSDLPYAQMIDRAKRQAVVPAKTSVDCRPDRVLALPVPAITIAGVTTAQGDAAESPVLGGTGHRQTAITSARADASRRAAACPKRPPGPWMSHASDFPDNGADIAAVAACCDQGGKCAPRFRIDQGPAPVKVRRLLGLPLNGPGYVAPKPFAGSARQTRRV